MLKSLEVKGHDSCLQLFKCSVKSMGAGAGERERETRRWQSFNLNPGQRGVLFSLQLFCKFKHFLSFKIQFPGPSLNQPLCSWCQESVCQQAPQLMLKHMKVFVKSLVKKRL